MVIQTVLLQMQLYALYERSNKILGFMAVCFLAEVSLDVYAYIRFYSTAQGWPETLTLWEMKYLITFDSYESTITRGLLVCSNNSPSINSL